ncbi:MAG: hypothetical protein CME07_05860 [Gemmatimonadetes bacterium]|nr:hypothetical protein [Gemmatimonadota bacterium]
MDCPRRQGTSLARLPGAVDSVLAATLTALLLIAGCTLESGRDVSGPRVLLPPTPPEEVPFPEVLIGQAGRSVIHGATGLFSQPATLAVGIPASAPSDILSATLYWCGLAVSPTGDATLSINGVEHTGELYAAVPQGTSPPRTALFYRMDASALVAPGMNSLTLDGFDLGPRGNPDGAALIVTIRDLASPYNGLLVYEPGEFVYWADPHHDTGAVHAFRFPPAMADRSASLLLLAGDCEPTRADAVLWATGPATSPPEENLPGGFSRVNSLTGAAGSQFDIFRVDGVAIPAGHSHFAFQVVSPPEGDGDSILLAAAVFSISATNIPPVPDAGGPYSGLAGSAVSFDGGGSFDPDGEILRYYWDFGDGAHGDGESTTHTYAAAGTYTTTLQVWDNRRAQASRAAQVFITSP